MTNKILKVLILAGSLLALCSPLSAAVVLDVSLDTSALAGNAAGPFSLDFQLIDGSMLGDGNSSVTVSGFSFGVGGAAGSPILNGGASGDLSSVVLLTDTAFFNDFQQMFTPGGTLSFHAVVNTVQVGDTPDQFSFTILDSSGMPIPTLAPAGMDIFLTVDPSGWNAFGSDVSRTTTAGGTVVNLGSPAVTASSATPEPGTPLLLGGGLIALTTFLRRRRAVH